MILDASVHVLCARELSLATGQVIASIYVTNKVKKL